ncbi:MAG: hypothetical protein Q9227_002644 [Pyrenula ochraceoflavens]
MNRRPPAKQNLVLFLCVIYGFFRFSCAIPVNDDPNQEEDSQIENMKHCTIFDPPNHDVSVSQCQDICGEAVAKQVAAGNTSSISCIAFGNIQWEKYDDDFVKALPLIAEIGCQIIMSAVNLVVNVGALAIPGVGEAIDGGMIAGISAAKLAAYAYDGGQMGLDAFSNWLNPCGSTSKLPPDLQKVFDIMNDVDSMVIPGGFKPPKGLGKGSGKPGDKGDPSPKDPSKTDSPKTTDPPETTDPAKTTDPPNTTDKDKDKDKSSCSKKKTKRNGDSDKDDCDDDDSTVTHIDKSTPKTTTITKTCQGKSHTQACYHYYSAIQNYDWVKSTFTCTDSNKRRKGKATNIWTQQHTNRDWWKYTTTSYLFKGDKMSAPECQADEFPPGYFWSTNTKQSLLAKTGQLIRWLPQSENGGAAKLWTSFCDNNDGGAGNGQTYKRDNQNANVKEGQLNKRLVSLQEPAKKKNKGADGTTTAIYDADFTRAVFALDFDWTGVDKPTKQNNWGLKENPCWPQDIVPDDPGYALLEDDNWYNTAAPKNAKDDRPKYKDPPDDDRVERADQNRKARGLPPAKADPNDGQRLRPRSLQMLPDGGIALRDETANLTRRLTEDEIRRDIQVIECADRMCTRERGDLEEQGEDETNVVVLPGEVVPLTNPVENPDTIPTAKTEPRKMPEEGTGTVADSRRQISSPWPLATGTGR